MSATRNFLNVGIRGWCGGTMLTASLWYGVDTGHWYWSLYFTVCSLLLIGIDIWETKARINLYEETKSTFEEVTAALHEAIKIREEAKHYYKTVTGYDGAIEPSPLEGASEQHFS